MFSTTLANQSTEIANGSAIVTPSYLAEYLGDIDSAHGRPLNFGPLLLYR